MDLGVDWINLAEDRNRWWMLVKMIINIQIP
jgi:hypothetical protein